MTGMGVVSVAAELPPFCLTMPTTDSQDSQQKLDTVIPSFCYNSGMSKKNEVLSDAASSVSSKAKARWADPAFRAAMKEKLKTFWADKKNRERMAAADKAGWVGRDDRREAVAAGVSAYRKGRPLSPEHRAAISAGLIEADRHHSQESKDKISAANLGKKMSAGAKKKLSVAQTEYQESIKYQRKASKRALQLERELKWHLCQCREGCTHIVKSADGKYAKGHHPDSLAELVGSPHDTPYFGKHGLVLMRGSWEVTYAIYLDYTGVEWEYEKHKLPFVFGERSTTYTPDFYLPEKDRYVEVKGYYGPENRGRMKAFLAQHPEIKLHIVFLDEYNRIREVLGLPPEKKH